MLKEKIPIFFRSVVRSGAGNLEETLASQKPSPEEAVSPRKAGDGQSYRGLSLEISDLESWVADQKISHKDLKLADRQTLLFYRTMMDLQRELPGTTFENMPLHLAVGPARTDLEGMLRWAKRIDGEDEWPMIQPAGAVSLLPNTPLSWVSIKMGLKGEGTVWCGFMEAGHNALMAAVDALNGGFDSAIVAAVNCPENYFVKDTFSRGRIVPETSLLEIGVGLLLSRKPIGKCLLEVEVFSQGEVDRMYSESPLNRPEETVCGGNPAPFEEHCFLSQWGNAMPASFLFALIVGSQGQFHELQRISMKDMFGNTRIAVVANSNLS